MLVLVEERGNKTLNALNFLCMYAKIPQTTFNKVRLVFLLRTIMLSFI